MRLLTATLASMLVLVAACDAQDTSDTEPPTPTETPISTASTTGSTTTTTTVTTGPISSTTTTPDEGAVEPGARCDSPEGYSIGYPEAWATNSGEVVTECGQFHPEPFEVTPATDERVAAITAFVDPVPFAEVAASGQVEEGERAATTIDGLRAVRLEYEVQEDGLWPVGTPITLYAVDVSTESEDRTLILDTVGLPQFDYERNQVVLDRMARTLEIEMDDVTAERRDGTTPAVLPAPIGEREDVGGFSFTFGLDEIQRFVLSDVEGAELRTIEPGV